MSSLEVVVVPNWVMLERVVFRRDDDESFAFPADETKAAVITATGTTTWNAQFRIAFDLAEPPLISRLYAHLPSFPKKELPLAIVATHHHLSLLRVGTMMSTSLVQDFFIHDASAATDTDDPSSFSSSPSSLVALPPCAEPDMDYSRRDGRLPPLRHRSSQQAAVRRLMTVRSMGLLCRDEHEFAVAELNVYKRSSSKVFADIYLFLKSAGKWDSMRLPILSSGNNGNPGDDIWQVCLWQTDAVIAVDDRWLCWVDYERGILFYDVFGEPTATVSFRRLPLDKFPDTQTRSTACCWLYRSVTSSAIDAAGGGGGGGGGGAQQQRKLMFINVARDDGVGYGALKPGAGFTISCHTLKLGGGEVWEEDYTVTSGELWSANNPDRLPRDILMFPQVDMDKPHVVHFVISEFGYVKKKTWLVAIDMNTRTVESFFQYTKGREEAIGSEGAYLTKVRSGCPMPFLPCEFSKYLHRIL